MAEKKRMEALNRLVVSTYKAVGFLLLGLIVGGLVSYLALQVFFVLNHRWASPTIVSPTDEPILALHTKLAEQSAARDRLAGEQREVKGRLEVAGRVAHVQKDFERRLTLALQNERGARRDDVRTLLRVGRALHEASGQCSGSRAAYAQLLSERSGQNFEAQLVEREAYLGEQNKVAELALSNLALKREESEYRRKLRTARREAAALEALATGKDGELTLEALRWAQELDKARLEGIQAQEDTVSLTRQLSDLEASIARYDKLIRALEASPYFAAADQGLTVVFVPYANRFAAEPGTKVYQCAAWLIWCHPVGQLGARLEGELSVKHPIRNRMVRGEMFEVRLDDELSAREDLLHLGHAPLYF